VDTRTARRVWIWAVSVLCLMASQLSAQTVVTGTVGVTTKAGIPAHAAVVYAQPIDRPVPSRPATFTLAQKNKAFAPGVLGVPVGSTVAFPNQDAIFHNVFSLTSPSPFDLGLYRAGASKTRVFAEAATYRVFCNIHPQMSAVIVVVPTPFVTVTDRDGAYTLTLPPGRYRVTATTGRGTPVSHEVAIAGASATLEPIEVDERLLVETPHTNKFGKPYPADAYRRD
jgi:plastocyanin